MYLIGINGGHIRSTAVVFCTDRNEVVLLDYGRSLNLHAMGIDRLILIAKGLLDKLARSLGLPGKTALAERTAGITLSLPGLFRDKASGDGSKLLMSACKGFKNQAVVDDTFAGLYAGVAERRGTCIFCGAGASIGIADAVLVQKLDGRGPVIGDFGSGFHLVTLFFQHVVRQLDRGLPSALLTTVTDYCNDQTEEFSPLAPQPDEDLQTWFDELLLEFPSEWRHCYPVLAKPILMAQNHIEESQPLIAACAKELAITFAIAQTHIQRLKLGDAPVVLQGSLLRKSKRYRQAFVKATGLSDDRFVVSPLKPVYGAMLLSAEQAFSGTFARELHDKLVNSKGLLE